MKRYHYVFLFAVYLVVSCGEAERPEEDARDFPLEALVGKWEDVNRENRFYEEWEKVGERHLKGTGYVLSGDSMQSDTVFIEQLEILPENGSLFYVVSLSGSQTSENVRFEMTSNSKGVITFENPQHDFPKKISYKLMSNVQMEVYLNGVENGEFGETRFSFIRQK